MESLLETSLEDPLLPMPRTRTWALIAARAAWFLTALIWIGSLVLCLPVYYQHSVQLTASSQGSSVNPEAIRAGLETLGLSTKFYAGYSTALIVFFALTYIIVAGIIFWKKSSDSMAFRVSIWMIIFGASFPPAFSYLPQALPAFGGFEETAFLILSAVRSLSVTFFFLLLYVFPDGRFTPAWTSIPAAAFLTLALITALFPGSLLDTNAWPFPFYLLVMLFFFATMIYAQVYRYRHVSNPVQRQQTKWVMFGLLVAVLGFVLLVLFLEFSFVQEESRVLALALDLFYGADLLFSFILLPIALGMSILRYRLYDIDLLVNRTLVYTALTAMLGLVYFGSVVLLQTGFQIVTGQDGRIPVVTVLSTLVIAAMFGPLRHRLQETIDRRFYRHRYDAVRELTSFSVSLRDELDLNQLSQHLLAVVQETMQPEQVSLWLIRTRSETTGEIAHTVTPAVTISGHPTSINKDSKGLQGGLQKSFSD